MAGESGKRVPQSPVGKELKHERTIILPRESFVDDKEPALQEEAHLLAPPKK